MDTDIRFFHPDGYLSLAFDLLFILAVTLLVDNKASSLRTLPASWMVARDLAIDLANLMVLVRLRLSLRAEIVQVTCIEPP